MTFVFKGKDKVFRDSIYGEVDIPELCVKIIDTPQFQRLSDISQLGGVRHVYPGARGTRFEHSIGVCHVASQFIKSLKSNQPELNITAIDILCVEIAGLCHDLGHGLYSHLFEVFLHHYDKKFCHEHASIGIFDLLIHDNNLMPEFQRFGLTDKDVHFIKELILGDASIAPIGFIWHGRESKTFLYDIVANKRNGIDVDKFDYFARDCHYTGLTKSFDSNRLMKYAGVYAVTRDIEGFIEEYEKQQAELTSNNGNNTTTLYQEEQIQSDESIESSTRYADISKRLQAELIDEKEEEEVDNIIDKEFIDKNHLIVPISNISSVSLPKTTQSSSNYQLLSMKRPLTSTKISSLHSSYINNDHNNIINKSTIQLEICYHRKEAFNVYQLFQTRYMLHKQVYQHHAANAIECMIIDALHAANPYLSISGKDNQFCKLSDTINDYVAYSHVTDSILKLIEWSSDSNLKYSKDLLLRIQKRDLYKKCGETLLHMTFADKHFIEKELYEKVLYYRQVEAGVEFDVEVQPSIENLLVVQVVKMGYGIGKRNPVKDLTAFYEPKKNGLDCSCQANGDYCSLCVEMGIAGIETVGLILPDKYEEVSVRVYCKQASDRSDVQRAFSQWCKELGHQPAALTPGRRKRQRKS